MRSDSWPQADGTGSMCLVSFWLVSVKPCGSASPRLLPRYYCALRWNSGLTRQMSVHATEEMSDVETGQMSAAETGQMSAAETRQMSTGKTGR